MSEPLQFKKTLEMVPRPKRQMPKKITKRVTEAKAERLCLLVRDVIDNDSISSVKKIQSIRLMIGSQKVKE